jgi:hypothetical protein
MNAIKIAPIYLRWHYTTAIADLLRIDGNIFWFLWHFFSVPDTLRTFFEPWERMGEKYKKGFDVPEFASTLVVNILMRIVGIIMRTILMFFAFVSFVWAIVFAIVTFFVWLLIPFAYIMLAFYGIKALLN